MMNVMRVRAASHLLPDPGGEVVRECLDEIEQLRVRARKTVQDIMTPGHPPDGRKDQSIIVLWEDGAEVFSWWDKGWQGDVFPLLDSIRGDAASRIQGWAFIKE